MDDDDGAFLKRLVTYFPRRLIISAVDREPPGSSDMPDFQKKGLICVHKRMSDLLYQSCRLFGASGSHDTQVLEAPNLFAD